MRRSKRNQGMNFGQLIEHDMRDMRKIRHKMW